VPEDIPDRHAAVFDPLGNAVHAVAEVEVPGRDVLVLGAGAIGLFAAAVAKTYGACSVIVQEPNAYRAGIARTLGIDAVIDPKRADAAAQLRDATDGLGPDVILEMSGNATALATALKAARNGAHVALMGIPAGAVALDLAEDVIMKGITLHGVTGRRMYDSWYRAQAFMRGHPALMDRIVTHVVPARRYADGFRMMAQGECGKVVLDFTRLDEAA
jgi:threonine 3-dehydrogenase